MSIKRDIIRAINAENEIVAINNIAYLKRWQKDALGEECDKMEIVFSYVSGVTGGHVEEIHARNYDGIIQEIQTATKNYMLAVADAMNKNLENGHR